MMTLNNSFRILSLSCRKVFQNRPSVPFYGQSVGLKTTLEEKIGLPPKPKKPLTPYFRFMQKIRPVVTSENPNVHINEIVKIIAGKWENLDVASKKKLQEDYKKDQILYLESRTKYDSKITNEQRDEIKHLKQGIAEAKQKRELKRRIRELGKPKKSSSAFLKFLSHERTVTPQGPNQTYKEWHKKTTDKWQHLTDKEKENFFIEAKKEREIYKKDLAKWEEKMLRLGHIDVVRHDALIDPPEPKSTANKVHKTKKTT